MQLPQQSSPPIQQPKIDRHTRRAILAVRRKAMRRLVRAKIRNVKRLIENISKEFDAGR